MIAGQVLPRLTTSYHSSSTHRALNAIPSPIIKPSQCGVFLDIKIILNKFYSGTRPFKYGKQGGRARRITARSLWATNSCCETLKCK